MDYSEEKHWEQKHEDDRVQIDLLAQMGRVLVELLPEEKRKKLEKEVQK